MLIIAILAVLCAVYCLYKLGSFKNHYRKMSQMWANQVRAAREERDRSQDKLGSIRMRLQANTSEKDVLQDILDEFSYVGEGAK